jgi:hypothetical protein
MAFPMRYHTPPVGDFRTGQSAPFFGIGGNACFASYGAEPLADKQARHLQGDWGAIGSHGVPLRAISDIGMLGSYQYRG